jgi:peptidoglycan hydrolase-like protein with peptidoglycan-binding domain
VRLLSRVAQFSVLAALTIGASLIAPGAAQADSGPTDPAICNSWATGDWRGNCEVKQGDQSNMVLAVQILVDHACGGNGLDLDGDFGGATYHAVTCFQSQHNLANDGEVGPKTWAALQGTIAQLPGSDPDWAYYGIAGVPLPGVKWFRKFVSSHRWYVANGSDGWSPMRTF